VNVDYYALRSRLEKSILAGYTVYCAVRSELKAGGAEAPRAAMAMVLAALRMPDESHPNLNTSPTWIDVDRGLIGVNDFVFAIVDGEPSAPTTVSAWCVWTLSVTGGQTCRHPPGQLESDAASFIGLSVLMRAGGVRKNLLRWVELIGPP
jgi:hypothetical protein